jgi:D-3-phosphoglycerate dehydrogenase
LNYKILICDSIHPIGLSILKKANFEIVYEPEVKSEDLLKKVGNINAIIVRSRTIIDRAVIDKASHLQIIVRAGAGLDNIDEKAAEKKKIKVLSTPEALTYSVAELAIGLMLDVLRKISYSDTSMKRGKWIKKQLIGRELKGKIVGIIGAGGRIGYHVCKILSNGFGAKVIGYDVIDISKLADEAGFQVSNSLDELISESDIITIHVPYLPTTHHLIDREKIDKMKKNAILINTARGRIVDGKSLLDAIKQGKILGAGLDVFHDEPPKEQWEKELISNPKIVCTSHIGSQTVEAQEYASKNAAEIVIQELKSIK